MTRKASDYTRLLAALREKAPPVLPVRVLRVRGLKRSAGCHGECSVVQRGGRSVFLIRLDAALTGIALVDALLHEWSHALGWTTDHPSLAHHGPEWGLALSRSYTVWEGLDA